MRRLVLGVTAAVALLLLAGNALAGTRSRHWLVVAGAEGKAVQAAHGIQVADYLPREIWIDAGDTVTWRIPTGEPHTVTFLAAGQRKPVFDPADPKVVRLTGGSTYDGTGYHNSGVIPISFFGGPKNAPRTYSLTFTRPGDYRYYCLLHGEMVGVVHVLPAGTPVPFTQAQYRGQGTQQAKELLVRGMLLERVAMQVTAANGALVVAGTGDVKVEDQDFVPARLTIRRGQTVTFLNLDPEAPHTVTFGPEPKQPGATTKPYGNPAAYSGGPLNSGYFGIKPPWAGPKFTVRFTKPGVYHFHCVLHDDNGMKGTVVVRP